MHAPEATARGTYNDTERHKDVRESENCESGEVRLRQRRSVSWLATTGVQNGRNKEGPTSETDLGLEQEDQGSEPADSSVVRTTLLLDKNVLDDGSLGDSGAVEALQQGKGEPGQLFFLRLRSGKR